MKTATARLSCPLCGSPVEHRPVAELLTCASELCDWRAWQEPGRPPPPETRPPRPRDAGPRRG